MEKVEPSALTRRSCAWLAAVTAVYVAGIFVLHGGLPFDHALSDYFFTRPCVAHDPHACWFFNKSDKNSTFILHTIPNRIFTYGGIAAGLVFIAGFFWAKLRPYRELAFLLVLGIGGVSGVVALLKEFTGHYCPSQLAFYNGPVGTPPPAKPFPDCFPASHPAPAFGLMVLYFAPLPRALRLAGLYGGILLGIVLGAIQMARGEHFLSHNLASLITALYFCALVRAWYQIKGRKA